MQKLKSVTLWVFVGLVLGLGALLGLGKLTSSEFTQLLSLLITFYFGSHTVSKFSPKAKNSLVDNTGGQPPEIN